MAKSRLPNIERQIFKSSSATYYFSSAFFPNTIQQDVFRLYSFVRVADDYVDKRPADSDSFKDLRKLWLEASKNESLDTRVVASDSLNERVVKNLALVSNKYGLKTEWVEAFLAAMQADLSPKKFTILQESLDYVYGSAEVIGLMMACIMSLPEEAYEAAQLQGRAMQWINFIRDIDEDNKLGRLYFPLEDLRKFGLSDLAHKTAQAHPDQFKEFIRLQIQRYIGWQYAASEGFRFIPRRCLVPLRSAVDMYNWTAEKIKRDPFIVYRQKVKPGRLKVIRTAAARLVKTR